MMKTSSFAVETSRSTTQSDSIVRQTDKRSSFLSYTTMNNKHIFNDNGIVVWAEGTLIACGNFKFQKFFFVTIILRINFKRNCLSLLSLVILYIFAKLSFQWVIKRVTKLLLFPSFYTCGFSYTGIVKKFVVIFTSHFRPCYTKTLG